MPDLKECPSISEFGENIDGYVGRLKEKRSPITVTIDGRAELVIQDAASYRALLERLDRAETLAAIRSGLHQVERGEGLSLQEVEAQIRRKHGLPG